MKSFMTLLRQLRCLILLTTATSFGADSAATAIEAAWFSGKQALVKKLAEKRLLEDGSDLGSQLLLLECATGSMDLNELQRLIPQIRERLTKVNTPKFLAEKEMLVLSLDTIEKIIPTVTPEMVAVEAHKSSLPNKHMARLEQLAALESDGLFSPLTPQEKELLAQAVPPVPDRPLVIPDEVQSKTGGQQAPMNVEQNPPARHSMVRESATDNKVSKNYGVWGAVGIGFILLLLVLIWIKRRNRTTS